MADKAKPRATKDTAQSKVTGKEYVPVEMPGTPGQRSNYRQTQRDKG